jgi:hypothetical protein
MRAKVIIPVFLLFVAAPFAFALSITEIDPTVGILFIGSAPPAGYGGPSPVLQTFGASMMLRGDGPFFLEPTLEFFGTYYDSSGARTVPTGIESGTGMFTIGALATLQAGLLYPVSKSVELGGSLGLDFLLRFPIELQNTNIDPGAALAYFYGMGRFIYPETRFIFRWRVADGVGLVFSLRAMYPLFHLWDGEGLPFYDQFMAAFDLGFVIGLGGRPAAGAANATGSASK